MSNQGGGVEGGEEGLSPQTIHGDVGAIIRTNRGRVRINHYHYGDLDRYRKMSYAELRQECGLLRKRHRATYYAFMHHPSAWWFVTAIAVLVGGGTAIILQDPSPSLAAMLISWVGLWAVAVTWIRMENRRRPLNDGLTLLRADLKYVEAKLAIHDAEEAMERRALGANQTDAPRAVQFK